jgi:putative FmdB family regulatory protein
VLAPGLPPAAFHGILVPMPIYEFQCGQCGKDSELLVRSSDWKGTTCPHCGSKKLQKKLSVFASSGGGDEPLPACGLSPKSGCGCCGGGPHRH